MTRSFSTDYLPEVLDLSQRFKDLLLSVYLYNEWRGYTQLEQELIPILERSSRFDGEFLQAVRKHAGDEKKHYRMFKAYFLNQGRMPFRVRKSAGYFDALARILVRGGGELAHDESRFACLCRAVVITELRGTAQLDALLRWPLIRSDSRLSRIFETIRKDEPSHSLPYQKWLRDQGHAGPGILDKIVDWSLHYLIAVVVIPAHFFDVGMERLEAFPDAGSSCSSQRMRPEN